MFCLRFLSFCLIGVCWACSGALADLVSPFGGETAPNFADVTVLEDRVRVSLEIDRSDFPIFVGSETEPGQSLAARTGRTMKVWVNGNAVTPVTRRAELRPRKARRTAATAYGLPQPRSADVVSAELDYIFANQPESIEIEPPMDRSGRPTASIGVMVTHMGIPVTDYRYLSQRESLRLNWEDPWFSRFDNPNLTRHHASPLMSFISVEPREVRHEIILRLGDLENWVELEFGNTTKVGSSEMRMIAKRASSFFTEKNPILVDGTSVTPQSVDVSRITVGAEGLTVLPDDIITLRRTTLLGVIVTYPQHRLPDQVQMRWDLFPNGLEAVPVTLTDPAGAVPAQARQNDPEVIWTNHLKTWKPLQTSSVPVTTATTLQAPLLSVALALFGFGLLVWAIRASRLATGLAGFAIALGLSLSASPVTSALQLFGPPDLSKAEAGPVVADLVKNAGVALLETHDGSFEKALKPFVPTHALTSVGDEIRRGLSVRLPSGASTRVIGIEDVTIGDLGTKQDEGSQPIIVRWTATVTGGHWGHAHTRQITYRALAEISAMNGAWMLTGLTILRADPI
ncbi:MAG: hypothetical protein GJ676_10615 [Rhodobacteraceae bacterium]|nr:hypothetical protein [Paracoccaceae bacterium]